MQSAAVRVWWAPRESNSAPTDYESAALTKHELEALKRVLVAAVLRARFTLPCYGVYGIGVEARDPVVYHELSDL